MPKPVPSAPPPAPKTRGALAGAAKRRNARRAAPRARARRANPDGGGQDLGDTLKVVGIGVGAYGGTRLIQRLAWTVASKKRPTWGKHAHAAAGVVAFAAVLFAGKKVRSLEPFHESILMGTGVAAAQGIVSAYVPRYAWLMNDCRPEDLRLPAATASPHEQAHGPSPAGDYLEQQLTAYEGGGAKRSGRPAAAALQTAAAADGDLGIDPQLLEELGTENIDDLYGGVFEDPTLSN